jgi:hypothetical protein
MTEPNWVALGAPGGAVDYVGGWVAGTTYKAGDVVRHNGIDYLAVNPSTGQTPPVAGASGIGLAFPDSPSDGQEFVLVDSLTVPTFSWRFRYTASITDAYKWIFIGGAPWHKTASVWASPVLVVGNYKRNPSTSFTLPRTGFYSMQYSVNIEHGSDGNACALAISVGATAPYGDSLRTALWSGNAAWWVSSHTAAIMSAAQAAGTVVAGVINDVAGKTMRSHSFTVTPMRLS